jgi:DNA-directed RNA polymerase specialized sigma24 family protein
VTDAERSTAMYDACRQRVWAYVVSHAGRQVADEVVSETFVIAWRRLDDVPKPPLPWLLGVARNVLRDDIRAQVRRELFAAAKVVGCTPATLRVRLHRARKRLTAEIDRPGAPPAKPAARHGRQPVPSTREGVS